MKTKIKKACLDRGYLSRASMVEVEPPLFRRDTGTRRVCREAKHASAEYRKLVDIRLVTTDATAAERTEAEGIRQQVPA